MTSEFENGWAEEMFKWARTSEEAKKAMELHVKIMKAIAVSARKAAKEKKVRRALKLGAECHNHGGPVTANNLELLNTLDEKKIILEVSYLKATVATELKLRKE